MRYKAEITNNKPAAVDGAKAAAQTTNNWVSLRFQD
jgi:hypothetical protein